MNGVRVKKKARWLRVFPTLPLLGSSLLPDKTVTNGTVKKIMVIGAWRNDLLVKIMGSLAEDLGLIPSTQTL